MSPPEPGIRNPTICLQTNDTLAFLVTHEHYPDYDLGHFYNTPGAFDWGRFRALAEESQLQDQSPHLFLQQFQQPGVYVFHLNSNRHRKMYVRTLPPGGQCFGEGPFVPTTPGYLIQTGIAKIPKPLKRSDWPGVLGEMVLLLGLCLLLLIQCHSLSWARKAAPQPTFRKHQQGYNLDAYASPSTQITSIRRGRPHQDSDTPRVKGGHGGSWEADEQVDLEGFDTETFFGILLKQSLSVTTKLGQTKEELKVLCLKLANEAQALQQLWGAERRIPASNGQLLESPQGERRQAAEAAARAAEDEARRRGHLAGRYAASLGHQLTLLRQDLRARQEQWGSFYSALAAAQRLLQAHWGSQPQLPQTMQKPEGPSYPCREVPQLDAVLDRLSQAVLQEGHRLKAWGVLGSGTGAKLLQPASTSPSGGLEDVRVNPVTKLVVPGPNCAMLPASGCTGPVPPGYFIHPDTGRVLPEAGNLGYDLQEATLVPTTDSSSGQVLALGGLQDASGNLMLPGDNFVEPLSGNTVRLQGVSQQEGRTVPHAGGTQALLDANVLVAQKHVIAVLRRSQERPRLRRQGLLEAAIKDMRQALTLSLHHALQQARRLQRQQEAAESIQAGSSRIGMMCYPGTALQVPVLYGMEIPDPEGSGLMVPVLGMASDGNSGDTIPLAGSMEDASGKGLVPIAIGAQAIDALTGEPGPVIGAQMDPSARVVVPVVQVLEALPREVRDPGLLDTLEKELKAREQYWCHQEYEEAWLVEHLVALSQELLSTTGKASKQQLRAAQEACEALESCCLREMQRRAGALSSLSSPERGLLSQADRDEWEQEAQVMLGMQKVLQSLGQVAEKLRHAAGWLWGQEEEMRLQWSRNQSPQVWSRARKMVQHLSEEFQEVVRERQSFLDRALGQLQYQRELSRLQLLHTQIVASGTPVCLENYPGGRFYGTISMPPRDQAAACPLLIPFLRSLTAALVGAQGHGLGLEDGGPGTAPKSSWQDLPKPEIMQREELITVQPTDLSAREFVVYQYGLSILHLLAPQLHAPEITLQIASHLPAVEASDNPFQGSFFYQRAENTLFVARECLASVGSFVLLLIHCLAHIAAKDLHQDSSPAFLRSFYKGLKAYFREAFAITLRMSAVSWDSKLDQSISAVLLEEQPISERGRDLLSKLIERKHESHLMPESSEEYIKKNKDLLLFTNMDHFLKSILAAEQQIPRKPRDQLGGEDKVRCLYGLLHEDWMLLYNLEIFIVSLGPHV
ncbi:uncharacterized protein LOC125111508 isoform X5 [Phacochoerus africanus]|uniref:uncharacterized protein LOC125111508 isoform X5 n=1 Tax=Phacochoerus africanus TaxID=41426 RepID=UPI001FDA81F8|nr:uncharacterized protein LOC125111508 isoform X5 [Phacochoerus africanus]